MSISAASAAGRRQAQGGDPVQNSAITRSTLSGRVGALGLGVALALGAATTSAQTNNDYEIWAIDQGTNQVHIYNPALEEVARIDLAAEGVRTAHMVDFTADHAYALIASTGSGDVTVVKGADRAIVARLPTGPRTHMATVSPDDSRAIAAVIGSPDEPGDGKLVEILIDGENESFTIGRTLVVTEDPLVQERADRFNETQPICQEFTADGRHAYVTLGPALGDGGLLVLDVESFTLVAAFPPDEVRVNCGTVRTNDGRYMFVNGGDHDVGVYYVFDTASHEVVHEGDTRGFDPHGVWPTPNGAEVWMVNRGASNAIVIDADKLEIVDEIEFVGKTPDIIAMSPDGSRAYISLRGPEPVTMPHVAVGETPGFAVVDIAGRELIEVIQPAQDDPKSDFHGIGVRVIHD
jgi:DNA-binding beta-propeller fold protein YncE